MSRPFVVSFTIDTEPDNQWSDHRTRSVENVQWLRPLQRIFADHGVRPTYLLTHSVATDVRAVAELHELCRLCPTEIGAHMHPWDNQPFAPDGWDQRHAVFPHDLPISLFADKLSVLSAAIGREFPAPRSYRAGRFGFVGGHARILESMGFVVDCSVTPLIDRREKIGRPRGAGGMGGRDFRNAPLDPYRMAYDDETRVGNSMLIELPVTSGTTRNWPERIGRAIAFLPRRIRGALGRAHVVRIVTASPVQFSCDLIVRMLSAALRRGTPAVNLTFHSSENMPGGSALFPTPAEVSVLHEKVCELIRWLNRQPGCMFRTAAEAAADLAASGRVRARQLSAVQG